MPSGINCTRRTADPFDLAPPAIGVPEQMEAFGRTLAAQGAGVGTRPLVPLLHSSNPRDLAGFVVDAAVKPLTWPDRGATAEGLLGAARDAAAAADARGDPPGTADGIRPVS
ncbi:MAG: VacJ family lipoprotein, partial [Acetobacteraceae bacterium]|nr:VacJ family lipoprotein [Acetobacteraceae bacterium]